MADAIKSAKANELLETVRDWSKGKFVEQSIKTGSDYARIFNESDGGGAKYENADGTASFAGVNKDTSTGIGAQLYDITVSTNKGSKLDVTLGGIYYTKGDESAKSASERDKTGNELATKSDVSTEASARESADSALSERIDNVEARGRYLSTWDCTTGKPETEPTSTPYAYKSGDYYIVAKVVAAPGIITDNFIPSGSSYTGAASTEHAPTTLASLAVGDTYTYDGTNWTHTTGSTKTVTFSQIAGKVSDNAQLVAAFGGKVDTSRTINNHALTADLTLVPADLTMTDYAKATAASAIEQTDNALVAIGKLDYKADIAYSRKFEITGTLTGTPTSSTFSFTVDKTYAEILEAWNAGKELCFTMGLGTLTYHGVLDVYNTIKGFGGRIFEDLGGSADDNLCVHIGLDGAGSGFIKYYSEVEVLDSSSTTEELEYILIDGTEYKIKSGGGTVTDSKLVMPSTDFEVAHAEASGVITNTVTYKSQTAGKVLASPTGESGAPSFRKLVQADISDVEFMSKTEMEAVLNA